MLSRLTEKFISRENVAVDLENVISKIFLVCKPIKIYVFGSWASDSMRECSDLDVAVILSQVADCESAEQALLAYQPLCARAVDLIFYDEANFNKRVNIGGLPYIIYREGVAIYPKGDVINDSKIGA